MFSVKLKKAGAPTRLVYFNVLPSWDDLASTVTDMFSISGPQHVSVMFMDEDNEMVALNNEKELRNFYEDQGYSDQSPGRIKFVVHDKQTTYCA
jgi:hypothetical protein